MNKCTYNCEDCRQKAVEENQMKVATPEPKKCCVKCRSGFTQSPLPDLCVNCKCHQSKPECEHEVKQYENPDMKYGMCVKCHSVFPPDASPPKEEKELCPIECQREHPSTHHNTPALTEQKGEWEEELLREVLMIYHDAEGGMPVLPEEYDEFLAILSRFIAAKKKEWESALLEKIKEEVGNMRHYSLCHRIDAHGCSFVGKFHGTKEELAERIQAVEELLRILNNLK